MPCCRNPYAMPSASRAAAVCLLACSAWLCRHHVSAGDMPSSVARSCARCISVARRVAANAARAWSRVSRACPTDVNASISGATKSLSCASWCACSKWRSAVLASPPNKASKPWILARLTAATELWSVPSGSTFWAMCARALSRRPIAISASASETSRLSKRALDADASIDIAGFDVLAARATVQSQLGVCNAQIRR